MVELNRRTFLSGSVAAGAVALFGTEAAHAAGAVKLPAKWDETADVVIVGSGFAGLAAAIEAKKAGASVVVLEKMATVGGNSIINGGILTATGCPQQKKHGIKDSPELLAHDMLVAGLYLNNPEKVKLVADNALSNYEWTVNELGVEYNPDAIGQEGGHSVPRYVFTKNGSGSGIVSRDVEYRTMQDPKLTAALDSTNQPGATSELWRETSRIGCAQVQNDWIQCTPWNNPKEKGMGIGWTFAQSGAAEYGLWVATDGKRFVNELANRKVRADAIMVLKGEGKSAVAICTKPNLKAFEEARPGMLQKLLEQQIIKEYKSLDEIAADYKMPVDTLKATVAEFNKAVETKSDPAFGRYINNEQTPLAEGPWYAAEMSPKVHHCMGGLVTDLQCRVIDVVDGKPVPGLFAAGEATGGVHGAVRLGSCAILDCLVNGRIAGQQAAKA